MARRRKYLVYGTFSRAPKQWARLACMPKERGAWPARECGYCELVFFAPRYQEWKSRAYREHSCVNALGETESQQQERHETTRDDLCARCHHARRFHKDSDGRGQCTFDGCTGKPEGWTIYPGSKACPSFVEPKRLIDRILAMN